MTTMKDIIQVKKIVSIVWGIVKKERKYGKTKIVSIVWDNSKYSMEKERKK